MSEYYKNCYKIQAQYEKTVIQNRQLQTELREKSAECEELKKQLEKNRKLTLEYISSGEKYLKALDEIEKSIKEFQCENCDAEVSECAWCDMKDILDIIKK